MLDRQEIYKKLYYQRYTTELQTMARPDTQTASLRASSYAVKNTNKVYLEAINFVYPNHLKAK